MPPATDEQVDDFDCRPVREVSEINLSLEQEAAHAKAVAARTAGPTGAYDYFELDIAFLRRKATARDRYMPVEDVLHGRNWVPYQGDRSRPVMWGDKAEDPLTS